MLRILRPAPRQIVTAKKTSLCQHIWAIGLHAVARVCAQSMIGVTMRGDLRVKKRWKAIAARPVPRGCLHPLAPDGGDREHAAPVHHPPAR
jgi:hypothetical protein